jgi:hypothetical protein
MNYNIKNLSIHLWSSSKDFLKLKLTGKWNFFEFFILFRLICGIPTFPIEVIEDWTDDSFKLHLNLGFSNDNLDNVTFNDDLLNIHPIIMFNSNILELVIFMKYRVRLPYWRGKFVQSSLDFDLSAEDIRSYFDILSVYKRRKETRSRKVWMYYTSVKKTEKNWKNEKFWKLP